MIIIIFLEQMINIWEVNIFNFHFISSTLFYKCVKNIQNVQMTKAHTKNLLVLAQIAGLFIYKLGQHFLAVSFKCIQV